MARHKDNRCRNTWTSCTPEKAPMLRIIIKSMPYIDSSRVPTCSNGFVKRQREIPDRRRRVEGP